MDTLNKITTRSLNRKDDLSIFIADYCGWDSARKISLPHFRAYLHQKDASTFDADMRTLFEAIDEKFSIWMSTINWPFRRPEDIGLIALRDEDEIQMHALSIINDIDEVWLENLCPLHKITDPIRWFKHASMLKKYRNFLVHEARQPGVNNRPERFDIPHYEGTHVILTETNRGESYWNLVYPSKFFYNLAKNAINSVQQEFVRVQLNPFDAWPKSEVYWIQELNNNTLMPPY